MWVPDLTDEIAAKKKASYERIRQDAIDYLSILELDTSIFEMAIFDEINHQRNYTTKKNLLKGLKFNSTPLVFGRM